VRYVRTGANDQARLRHPAARGTSSRGVPLAATRGTAEAYDGLAEIWWDSLDALVAASASEEGQRANETLTEDEARFIDFERSSFFLTEEHTILKG